MKIYLLNLLLLTIYRLVFLHDTSQENNKKFCALATLNWILLSGLRHLTVGADTIKYGYLFEQAKKISWRTLWDERVNIFIHESLGKDPGYIVFQKLIQLITTNYRFYLILVAVMFTVPLGIWIYKNSRDAYMSFIIYSCMFYSFFSITGIRQTLATALVVFVGYRFIKKRSFIKFLLLIFLAGSIHFSAFCFLPFYFIADKKITKHYLILYGCAFMGIFLLRERIFILGSKFIGYDQYLPNVGGRTWVFTAFLISLALVMLLKLNKILNNNAQAVHFINALLVAVLLVPFTFVNPAAMRVIQYFSVFIMLLVPEIIFSFPKKERYFVYLVVCSTLVLLLIKNNPVYIFFWQ